MIQPYIIKIIVWGMILHSATAYGFTTGRTFYSPRSQSVNAARELVGWYWGINRCCVGEDYGSFSGTFEITKSFQSRNIARYFFATDFLTFTGSRVPDRSPTDILADYFGLPTDFKSNVLVRPYVENVLFDVDWFYGLDAWYKGVYLRVHAPLVHTKWDLNLDECVVFDGTNNYPAGYMASFLIDRCSMASSVTQSMAGNVSFGDYHPLEYGKVDCAQKLFGLSDIQIAFGWNMVNAEAYHFGINVRTSIPTGTIPKGIFLFEPIIGNGHHWELGIGLSGHAVTWYCNDEWMMGIYGDLNVTHLFGTHQRRSFDFLRHGSGSRYILLQEMGNPVVDGVTVAGAPIATQYHGTIFPAINATTLGCDVSIAVQVDLALMLTWQHEYVNFDIGYNLWGRSAEKIQCRECFPNNRFAFKGDAQVYGFVPGSHQFVAINATQSVPAEGGVFGRVRIESAQGNGSASQAFANTNADNAGDAAFNGVLLNQSYAPAGIVNTGLQASDITIVQGSNPPELLTNADIDDLSAVSGTAFTNKFFVYAGYTFVDRVRVLPYLGLGGEVELDGASTRLATNSLSQWGIWIKGGVSY